MQDEDGFGDSLGNQQLLAKIDKLRELNVGSIVPLPQLVVVGDQSSGKSSVLESITGFSFPRATTLCTRYATQITCVRHDISTVEISIIPSPNASESHRERLQKFYRRAENFSNSDLVQVFIDANAAMGIRGEIMNSEESDEEEALPTFSQDVLKIVLNGPKQSHLTVIDVPGIFRTETPGITTAEDILLVRNMVQKYMKDRRTIILAVIPCNIDIATQEILKLAKDADPEGKRTMGVLTKPDLAVETATKLDAIKLVNGNKNYLRLGYCIVKNRGADDTSSSIKDRNQKEREFFSQEPWSELSTTGRTGVESLKNRLSELLMDICRREFPVVKEEIKKKLNTSSMKLEEMGPSRSESNAQRIYLGRISDKFQKLAQHALDASYTHHPIFYNDLNMRLITRILELDEVFEDVFRKRAHERYFESTDNNGDNVDDDFESDYDGNNGRHTHPVQELSFSLDEFDDSDIADIIEEPFECPPPKKESIMKYIEEELRNARGRELGTVPATLLATTYKEQTKKWEACVLSHVSQAILIVHNFIKRLLEVVCPDQSVRDELWDTLLLEELRTAYKRAIDHAKFLLDVERGGWPMTLNHFFATSLDKKRVDRLARELSSLSPSQKIDSNVLNQVRSKQSNAQHARDEIHDALWAYYKVSSKRFVDVVCQQAIDHFLLTGKHSPLSVFSNEQVNRMSVEQLEMVAGEDLGSKRERKLLSTEIKRLEQAMKVLRG